MLVGISYGCLRSPTSLGHISKALRLIGVQRSTYYRGQTPGRPVRLEALHLLERRRPRMPNEIALAAGGIVAFPLAPTCSVPDASQPVLEALTTIGPIPRQSATTSATPFHRHRSFASTPLCTGRSCEQTASSSGGCKAANDRCGIHRD